MNFMPLILFSSPDTGHNLSQESSNYNHLKSIIRFVISIREKCHKKNN